MTAAKQTWKAFYTDRHDDYNGNCVVRDFTSALNSDNEGNGIIALSKIQNFVIFTDDAKKRVALSHSPFNFGGNRIRKENKVTVLIGLDTEAQGVLIDEKRAVKRTAILGADLNLIDSKSTKEELKEIAPSNVNTQDVENSFLPTL